MNVSRFVLREIAFRRLNFLLGLLAVVAAVGGLVAALASLARFQRRSEELLAEKKAQTEKEMAKLKDDYRKITKQLGFNVLILPKDQNLADLFAEDYAARQMPEEYAERLARARVATINHLLPILQQKIKWPETERTILLVGTRGEIPMAAQDEKKPLLDLVPAGTLVVGYELHRSLKLSAGQKVWLLGRQFTVAKLNPERGTKDDITVWMNLKEAQELLDKPGRINAILALECVCATARLPEMRAEIRKILPETQVIEFAGQALARAEARQRAEQEAEQRLKREEESRAGLLAQRESFAAILAPALMAASALWIALLAWVNARERRFEIGILRAIGWRAAHILELFLGKALALGLAGAAVGYLAGLLVEAVCQRLVEPGAPAPLLFSAAHLLLALLVAPLLACAASWLPAWLAAQQDPAATLREG